MIRHIFLFTALLLTPVFSEKPVYGWLEYLHLGKGDYRMKAKLDSGAKTSSLHILHLEIIKDASGKEKVRFKIKGSVPKGDSRVVKTVIITKPIHRTVKIKSSNGDISTRVSVLLPIRIGNQKIETEFTLSNREDMNYPVLLGRESIKDLGLVDCDAIFLKSSAKGEK